KRAHAERYPHCSSDGVTRDGLFLSEPTQTPIANEPRELALDQWALQGLALVQPAGAKQGLGEPEFVRFDAQAGRPLPTTGSRSTSAAGAGRRAMAARWTIGPGYRRNQMGGRLCAMGGHSVQDLSWLRAT